MNDPQDYCRQVETYLCQKNEGHLVRIVGPAFEQVRGWALQGVPLRIAFRGIDRYCERYYAKGPRRRPVRIEFCEDDVLDAFDDWRRAVGVTAVVREQGSDLEADEADTPRKPALCAHIERALARLTASRAGRSHAAGFATRLSDTARELDALQADARHARGDARARIIARLAEIDAALMRDATAEADAAMTERLRRDAADEIQPFALRMPTDARENALAAAERRLLREALELPVISFDW
jgi:hypothetical protein